MQQTSLVGNMALQISSSPVKKRCEINDTIALVAILNLAKHCVASIVERGADSTCAVVMI